MGSNHRPSDHEPDELPTALLHRTLEINHNLLLGLIF